jgi:hypothetical protein
MLLDGPTRPPLLRLGALVYWSCFAIYTAWVARYPGPWGTAVGYPLMDVVLITLELGLATYVLHFTLRPHRAVSGWQSAVASLAFCVLMLKYTLSFLPTDQPPYFYVPSTYAATTTAVVLVVLPLTARRRSNSG